jgi:type IV pilus assembly protein PilE
MGMSLLEVLVAVAIAALLAAVAYPSYVEQMRKARRSDAITRLALVQQAQERWRANHPSYATLAELGIAPATADALYQLSVSEADANGYVADAAAAGAQEADTTCRVLRLRVAGGNTAFFSGPDPGVANDAARNGRCWNR